MIDRTNVGISPLMSTPITTQYLGTSGIQTGLTTDAFSQPATLTADAFAQPITYGTGSLPLMPSTFASTPIIDQGFALPQVTTSIIPDATASLIPQGTTTLLPDAGLVPQTTLPDQVLTSFIPEVNAGASIVPTPDIQTFPLATTPITSVVSQPVASVVSPIVPSVVTPPVVSSLAVPGAGLSVGGIEGSALPPLTSPELVSANPLAQTTGAYSTSSTAGGAVPPPAPQNQPVGPIMDEDFQRGRPVYDELDENRYRGFRMGR